jgi:hypothetical protein
MGYRKSVAFFVAAAVFANAAGTIPAWCADIGERSSVAESETESESESRTESESGSRTESESESRAESESESRAESESESRAESESESKAESESESDDEADFDVASALSTEEMKENAARVTPAMIAKYEGDWIGCLKVDSDDPTFTDWSWRTWDVAARFSFKEDGTVTIFFRTPFPDEEFDFEDLYGELDPWFEDIFLTGSFLGFPMDNPTNLSFTYSGDGSIFIKTALDTEGTADADLRMTLRRVGDPWTGEEDPGIEPERAATYQDMTLEEIMKLLGISAEKLPEASHLGVADPSAEYMYFDDDPYA